MAPSRFTVGSAKAPNSGCGQDFSHIFHIHINFMMTCYMLPSMNSCCFPLHAFISPQSPRGVNSGRQTGIDLLTLPILREKKELDGEC